jgi:hypothetical protein
VPAHSIRASGIPFRALTQFGCARDEVTRPWQTTATQSRNLEGKGAQRTQRQKGVASGKEARHGCYPKGEPLLKADFPTRAPKRHRQGLPRCAPGFPSYDMGVRPHMSYKLARSMKKANRHTRSMQPPCGYTPFHLRHNQRSRRRTAAQGACNRPAVIHPSISAVTSSQGGEPPHKEHATAPRLRAPLASLQPVVQPLAWEPRPTCHTPGVPVSECRKVAPPLAPIPRLLEAVAEG